MTDPAEDSPVQTDVAGEVTRLLSLSLTKELTAIYNVLPRKKLFTKHKVECPGYVWRMLEFEGEIFCLIGDSIEVYNASTGHRNKPLITGLKKARSTIITSGQQLLIATLDGGLLEYDLQGEMIKCINPEPHRDVIDAGDGAVALRLKDGKIYIDLYNSDLQRINEAHETVQVDDYRFTTIVAQGSLYVCSTGQNCICKVDLRTGRIIQTYGWYGGSEPGELDGPFICCTDGRMLLMADSCNHRLQIFDCKREKWKVLQLEGLHYPTAGVVDNDGRVFVAGAGENERSQLYIIDETHRETFLTKYNSPDQTKIVKVDPRYNISVKDLVIEHNHPIGHGGFSHVVKGKYLSQEVAIKLLHTGSLLQVQNETKLWKEAKNLCSIQHKYVISYFGVLCDDDAKQYGLVMEYCTHGSLHSLLEKCLVGTAVKCEMVWQVACGMAYIHSMSMIHKDIKASNILIDDKFTAKIADFGQSRFTTTRTTTKIGTWSHMAPETHDPKYKPIAESDMWSFGILLFEIFAEECRDEVDDPYYRLPFGEDANDNQIIELVRHKSPITEEQIKQKISATTCPDVMIDLMKKCTEVKIENRPKFTQIIDDLRSLLDGKLKMQLPTEHLSLLQDLDFVENGTSAPVPRVAIETKIIADAIEKAAQTEFLGDAHCQALAYKLGTEWEQIARYLGYTQAHLDHFKESRPNDMRDQIVEMLVTYRQRELSSEDKHRKFVEACLCVGRADLFRNETDCLTAADLCALAPRLGNDWRLILTTLGLTTDEIDICLADNHHNIINTVITLLEKWINKATDVSKAVDKLQRCLKTFYKISEAEWIQEIFDKHQTEQLRNIQAQVATELRVTAQVPVPRTLRKQYTFLLNKLPALKVAEQLCQLQCLTENQKRQVLVQPNDVGKNRCLLRIIAEKGDEGVEALEEASKTLGLVSIVDVFSIVDVVTPHIAE